jgi:hypothetical protein
MLTKIWLSLVCLTLLFLMNQVFSFFPSTKDWSDDGQLLTLSTVNGAIHAFLTKLPLLASVCQNRIAFMTSLKEISIYDHIAKAKVFYFY